MNNRVEKLRENINKYFVGKNDVVDNVLICMLAGGHVLLEDVPGVGKTVLAKTIAKSMDAGFSRIQFTPDTLPGDIVGMSIYDMKTGEFRYREGAVMAQLILADEINRTSPKTQASLLEAMAEGQVTVDGNVYKLPDPFMVIATQNPIEFLGTYPLPEAQMDRFMMRLTVGYPDEANETLMVRNIINGDTPETIAPVCTTADVCEMRAEVTKINIKDSVLHYIREIVDLTRKESRYVLGASPRATIALTKAAQAKAYLEGRDFVKPDDVKAVAGNVLSHRLVLTSETKISGENPDNILRSLIIKAKVPME